VQRKTRQAPLLLPMACQCQSTLSTQKAAVTDGAVIKQQFKTDHNISAWWKCDALRLGAGSVSVVLQFRTCCRWACCSSAS